MTKRSEDVWYAVGDEVRTYRGTLLTVNEWLTDEEAEEVARVAAAAPQMLKALELVADCADQRICSPYIAKVLAAIRKAKGEEDE